MAITKLHYKQRLLRVARFLDKLPEEKFDFSKVVSHRDENCCGTVCCAVGWMPKIDPKNWFWFAYDVTYKNGKYTENTYFGLTGTEYYKLFYSMDEVHKDFPHFPIRMHEVKPTMLAHTIRRFVKEKFDGANN